MDPTKIKAALDAIEAGDEAAALALLKELIASAAGGGEGDPPATDNALGENAEAPPPAAGEEDAPAKLARLEATLSGMAATIERLSQHTKTQEQAAANAEASERVELVASLVKLGAETPATAWSGKPEDRKPAEPWASVAIGVLRERVKRFGKTPARLSAPVGDETSNLTDAEQAAANKITDPAAKQRFVNLRLSRKVNAHG